MAQQEALVNIRFNHLSGDTVVFCNGCMATLMLNGAPGMELEDAIRAHQWGVDEEGILCPKCDKLATQQASFKGIL